MNSVTESKGTYSHIFLGPTFFQMVIGTLILSLGYLLTVTYHQLVFMIAGLCSPIMLWILDRFLLQKEIKAQITAKEIRWEGKSTVAYLITPAGWKLPLQVDEFIYSLLDHDHALVVARFGLLSRQVSRITIL